VDDGGKSKRNIRCRLAVHQFLSQTENDIACIRETGYFPATNAAVDALDTEGWFEEIPISAQLLTNPGR
jgi:hypothetical protein